MKVKTTELRNNLSMYLKRVKKSGKQLIICDRDQPIARILPIADPENELSESTRASIATKLESVGLFLDLPIRLNNSSMLAIRTRKAPDGKIDISTIDFVRGGRDY